ncbi:MAG: glycosyltransferase [Desulfurococcaceae archaeon]
MANLLNVVLSFPLVFYIMHLRPKIILASVPEYSILIPSYVGARIVKAKLVVDIRDPPETSFHSTLTRTGQNTLIIKFINTLCRVYYSICSRAHLVTAVTENLKARLEKKSLKNVVVVPNGADLAVFKSIDRVVARQLLGMDDDTFLIAYTGMIGGYHELIKVMILVRKLNTFSNRKIKLILAGPIVDKMHQRLINSLVSENIVIYLGNLDTRRLVEVLSASDIGIIPLIASPIFDYAIPVKFYEYIAIGLPVIVYCNKDSELWKLVEENGLGFACRPSDLYCVEHSLKTLMLKDAHSRIKIKVENYRSKVDRVLGARILLIIIKHLLDKG